MSTTIVAVKAEPTAQRNEISVSTTEAVIGWSLLRAYSGITEIVRGDDPLNGYRFTASGLARTLYDTESPRGLPIRYQASAITATTTVPSATSTGVILDDPADICTWWVHPLSLPRQFTSFEPEGQVTQAFPAANGVFRPSGRADPLVMFGTRQTGTGDLRARCATYAEADQLRLNVAASEVLVIRAPVESGWATNGRRYVALDTIALDRLRVIEQSIYSVALPWIEVGAPTTPVIGWGATWAQVGAGFADWNAVDTSVGSWNDLVGWVP